MSNKTKIIEIIIKEICALLFAFVFMFNTAVSVAYITDERQQATQEVTTAAETTTAITETTEAETEPELIPLGKFKLTAYCPCVKCCGKSDGITASGSEATEGRTIAVDPSKIPYGTQLVINGHTYIAEDCGGAVKGNKADIFFNSHAEALAFGVQYADVYAVNVSLCNE